MLQSYEIFERFIPKFFSESANPEDIEKGELILSHILKVDKKLGERDSLLFNNSSYYSPWTCNKKADKRLSG